MIDINIVRNNPELVRENIKKDTLSRFIVFAVPADLAQQNIITTHGAQIEAMDNEGLFTYQTDKCPECGNNWICRIDHDYDEYDTGRARTRWACTDCGHDWWTFDEADEPEEE